MPARRGRQRPVVLPRERRDAEPRQAALGEAEDVALAAQREVDLGKLEPVAGPLDAARRSAAGVSGSGSATSTQYDASVPRPTRPRSW